MTRHDTQLNFKSFLLTATVDELRAAFLGVVEYRLGVTTNPGDELIEAYDTGRELAHQITDRAWDWQ